MQPLLFLLVLGTGLSNFGAKRANLDFKTFIFPGVIAMSVRFTAICSAVSIVWDREFGFMRDTLVAPIHRSSLVIGKCLGGATVATFQGCFMLVLAGLAHVPYLRELFVVLIVEMALLAFTLTGFDHLSPAAQAAAHHINPGMTWNGHLVPTALELVIVAAPGLAMMAVAMFQFNRPE